MKCKSVSIIVLASGITLAAAACSKDKAAQTSASVDTAATTPGGGDHPGQFLANAVEANNAEIEAGQAATKMGSTKPVRDYGKMLVDDHKKANDAAKKLAQSMNVPVPTGTTTEAQSELKMATSMSGTGFDKDFVSAMVKDHQKAIEMFQREADSGDPAQVTAFAKQTLPTLKKHLQTAQSLNK